jgi:hypothetical protein
MQRPFNRKLACLAMLATTAALATSAQSASAAPSWHFGSTDQTWIADCYDGYVVNGVSEYGGAFYDDAAPPKPGDVFYVNVVVAGIDSSCAEDTIPDVGLPAGMSTAISSTNPILCYTVNISTSSETPDTADCPSALGAPLTGGSGSIRNPNGTAPGDWDTRAPKAWEFKIPVVASTSGDKLIEFPTTAISAITRTMNSEIVVPIAAGPPVGPTSPKPGANTPLTLGAAAKKAKLSSRGVISFTLTSSETGTGTASGTISIPGGAKTVRLAKRTLKLAAGKATKVALKLSRKNAAAVRRALRRGKKLTAHIVVTAKGASGASATKKLSLKLRG